MLLKPLAQRGPEPLPGFQELVIATKNKDAKLGVKGAVTSLPHVPSKSLKCSVPQFPHRGDHIFSERPGTDSPGRVQGAPRRETERDWVAVNRHLAGLTADKPDRNRGAFFIRHNDNALGEPPQDRAPSQSSSERRGSCPSLPADPRRGRPTPCQQHGRSLFRGPSACRSLARCCRPSLAKPAGRLAAFSVPSPRSRMTSLARLMSWDGLTLPYYVANKGARWPVGSQRARFGGETTAQSFASFPESSSLPLCPPSPPA